MPTISRRWPRSAPRGDYAACCDYCGARFRRSQLVRKSNGLLACKWDAEGRDEVELSRANLAAMRSRSRTPRMRGGRIDTDAPYTAIPPFSFPAEETPTEPEVPSLPDGLLVWDGDPVTWDGEYVVSTPE